MSAGNADVRKYRTELLFALRANGVPGGRISEIVNEVERQAAVRSESPYALFGAPAAYAATLASTRPAATLGTGEVWLPGLLALAALVLVIDGVAGMAAGAGSFGIEPIFVLLVGLGFGALAAWFFAHRADILRDRRSGMVTGPGPWWIATGIVAAILAVGGVLEMLL